MGSAISQRKVIHLVDDHKGTRESLQLLLSLRDYHVFPYQSAEDFLAHLTPSIRGCLLTDLRMPGIGGLELQRIIAKRGIKMPIVLITAHPNLAAARVAFHDGAVDFLGKPLSEPELFAALDRAMP